MFVYGWVGGCIYMFVYGWVIICMWMGGNLYMRGCVYDTLLPPLHPSLSVCPVCLCVRWRDPAQYSYRVDAVLPSVASVALRHWTKIKRQREMQLAQGQELASGPGPGPEQGQAVVSASGAGLGTRSGTSPRSSLVPLSVLDVITTELSLYRMASSTDDYANEVSRGSISWVS